MDKKGINQKERKVVFISLFLFSLLLIALFNYFIDPYYIFRDKTFFGINNVKLHKYTNKRTVLYSNIKINKYGKDTAFTGNCLLSNYGFSKGHIAFFTLPQGKIYEIVDVINNLTIIAPNIKTIYWGLFFDDVFNDFDDEVTDTLPELDNKNITLNDIINLFLSWNTTKYSIETLITSIKNKGKDIIYIYPYKQIAIKDYHRDFSLKEVEKIKTVIEKAKENGVEIICYYSPIHVSKKVHMYTQGIWDENMKFKELLSEITPFLDYSVFNEYNTKPLDKNSKYFIDNIHPTDIFNNIIVNDILSENHKIGVLVTKNNVKYYNNKETNDLKNYIKTHQDYTNEIKKITKSDADTKIPIENN